MCGSTEMGSDRYGGCSSFGRALPSHGRGTGFDYQLLHSTCIFFGVP